MDKKSTSFDSKVTAPPIDLETPAPPIKVAELVVYPRESIKKELVVDLIDLLVIVFRGINLIILGNLLIELGNLLIKTSAISPVLIELARKGNCLDKIVFILGVIKIN